MDLGLQLLDSILYSYFSVTFESRFVDLVHEKLMNSVTLSRLLIRCYFARIVSVSRRFRRVGFSGPKFCKYINNTSGST